MVEHEQHSAENKTVRRRYHTSRSTPEETPVMQPLPEIASAPSSSSGQVANRRRGTADGQTASNAVSSVPQQTNIPEASSVAAAEKRSRLNEPQPATHNSGVPLLSGRGKQKDKAKQSSARAVPKQSAKPLAPAFEKAGKCEQPVEKRTPESFDMRYSRKNQTSSAKAEPQRQRPADSKQSSPPTEVGNPEGASAEKPAETPSLKKKLPYYIGIAVCSIVLIVSGTLLIRYYSQVWRANRASNQLRTLYTEPAATDAPDAGAALEPASEVSGSRPTEQPAAVTAPPLQQPAIASTDQQADFLSVWPQRYPGNEGMVIQSRFEPLRHQNRDIVGWLSIDGVVDEPVFQRDNSYYLTHDANGTANPTGALFLDENCNLRTVPMMTLIHGHNMKEGAMFGSLKKYKVKDASFYRQHPFVTFDTLYETATYVIFSVAEVNIVAGNTHYFPFWHKFHFDTQESFDSFVLLAKEYSRFKVDIDVQPGDRLLTLATCSSEDSNLRLIVMARMLREDEDKVMLSNKIYSAVSK